MIEKLVAAYILIALIAILLWVKLAPAPRRPAPRTDFDRSIEGRWGRIRERDHD